MKVLIGIPAYNEEQTIKKVLRSIPKKIKGCMGIDVLVVNDGSLDHTAERAKKEKVFVISHIINRGLGGALKTIFEFARTYKYDVLITIDADGQHKTSEIEPVTTPIVEKKADVVIGSRWINGRKKPLIRYLINSAANLITFLLFGLWTSDSQSGFRAFGKKAIEKIILSSDGMEVSSEFFKEIKRNKLSLLEVPISVIYTDYSRQKGQKLWDAPIIFLELLLRILR